MENFFYHKLSAPRESVMWTIFKKQEKQIRPKGYTKLSKDRMTFVPCSCKATEAYKDRYNLAYLIDRYPPPGLLHFFAQKGIHIDADGWALAELIQWIFRSRIRDSRALDRSINLYLPSARMRRLIEDWLGANERLLESA